MNLRTLFAYNPQDSEETRLEKFTILLVAGSCCLAGSVWTVMYYLIFGWGVTTALPLAFVIIVGAALAVAHVSKNHHIAVYAQILCIIFITTFIQWSVGGVFDSGVVMIWAFMGPLAALMFFSLRQAMFWFAVFLVNLLVTVGFNGFFAARGLVVAPETRLLLFGMNFLFSSLVVFIFAGYYVITANHERRRANTLLLNILPREIAPILKSGQETIADHYDSASVLFADIVGSTPLFAGLEPAEVVDWLNEVFSLFDGLVAKYGVEKIRTIGDNYMVAAGVPTTRPDHAQAVANLALDMIAGLNQLPPRHGRKIAFRIGIHSGPLVAGVIGKSKFQYDLWGDTVNTASRMESHGVVNQVQISAATYELIKAEFECESRGVIPVKGKGEMATWFLLSGKNSH